MNAPIPTAVTGHHQYIALTKLSASPLNRRKIFDEAKMKELADSVSVQGIIQPILARPLPGDRFEVVAGERRYRAAKMAKLVDVPAVVRELTDAQALELQVIENGQRVDLHPLEEAEGYEALMKVARADGTHYSVDEIAAKVGKSRAYIYARLKLAALCPEARKVFYAGDIDASKGLLIARIGHHDTQRQALKDITGGQYGRGPMSYREAHQHILQTFMLALKTAPFDIQDAALLPKAGACGPCPKRTGNQQDLFGDVKSADVCTDPKCFDDKRQAHYSVAVRELEAAGNKVIAGAAAKKVFADWDTQNQWARDRMQPGYLKLDDTTYAAGRGRTVKDVLGPDHKPLLIQHPATGEIFKIATQQAVTSAAAKLSRKSADRGQKQRAPREKEKSKDELFRERLFLAILPKIPDELGKPELAMLAQEGIKSGSCDDLIADAFCPLKDGKKHKPNTAGKAIQAAVLKMDVGQLSRFVIAALISADVVYSYGKAEVLLAAAQRYRVDPAKIKSAIAEEAKAAAKAKPAKKSAKHK